MKVCIKCGISKNISEFHKKKVSKDGHVGICKICRKNYHVENREYILEKAKEYYVKNSKKRNSYNRNYYKENKDDLLRKAKIYQSKRREHYTENARKYYINNREERLEYRYRYIESNKEKISKYSKEYFKTEKGKAARSVSNHNRRSTMKDGDLTAEEILNLKKNSTHCPYCNCELEFDKKLAVHLDHIIPLSKGGKHTLSNVVFACQFCNISKGNKII